MTKEIKKKLRFNNRDIHNHISNFVSSTGKNKDRVYTSFKMTQTTQLKGLNLCEYKKGEKHFVIQFYMKGQRTLRRFTLGKFNNNLNVVTGEINSHHLNHLNHRYLHLQMLFPLFVYPKRSIHIYQMSFFQPQTIYSMFCLLFLLFQKTFQELYQA